MADVPGTRPQPAQRPNPWFRDWLSQPAAWPWVIGLGIAIIVLPIWLWSDPLDGYSVKSEGVTGLLTRFGHLSSPFETAVLIGDDYSYIAGSRTFADLSRNLWKPHSSHVVPLFRAWTYFWVRAAGSLARLPLTLAIASYLTYLAAILLIGHLVAVETGKPTLGLVAMVAFGVSAVLEQTVQWYSAGQAIASGVCILVMLVALQAWRCRSGGWRLAIGVLAAAAAPLVWTVGYIAGPVGAAYLWADRGTRSRRWALLPILTSAIVALAAFSIAGREVASVENFHGRSMAEAANPVQGFLSTAQGIVEILILRNLGLYAETTSGQALVILIFLAAIWAWTRGLRLRPNPLEAAGAVMVVLGFALVYTARGYYEFSNLRDLHWYQAVPQIGGVLFAVGWWSGRSEGPPMQRQASTRGGLLAVTLLLAAALILQAPVVHAHLNTSVPPLTSSERARFPIPLLARLRARYLRTEQASWQRLSLARLDLAEAHARVESLSRQTIREALRGPVGPNPLVPFATAPGTNAVDLLALPETGPRVATGRAIPSLLPYMTREPEPRPPWLPPEELWPPSPGTYQSERTGP